MGRKNMFAIQVHFRMRVQPLENQILILRIDKVRRNGELGFVRSVFGFIVVEFQEIVAVVRVLAYEAIINEV